MEPQQKNQEKRPKTPPQMTLQDMIKLMNYRPRSRTKSQSSKTSFKQTQYYDNLHNSPQPKQQDNSTIKRQIVSQLVLPAPIYHEQRKQQKIFNRSIIRANQNSNSTIKVDQSQLLDQTVNEQTSNKSDMLVKKQEKQIQKVEEKLEIQRIDQSRNQGYFLPLQSRMIDRERREFNGNETERMMVGQGQYLIQNPFTENNSQDKNEQFSQEPKYFFSPFLKNNTLRQQQATYRDKIKQNESLLLSPFELSPIPISPRHFAQQKRKSDQQEDILFFSRSPYVKEEQKEPASPFNSQERSQNKGRKNGQFRKLSPKPQKLIAQFQYTQEKIQKFQQKPQKKQQCRQQKQILLDQNENKNRNNEKFQQDRLTFIPPLPLKSSNQPTKNTTSIRIKRSKSERNQNQRQIDYFKENILGYIQNKQHILPTKIIKKQKGKQSSISKKSNHSNSTVKKSQSQKSIQQNDPNKTHRIHEIQGIACQCNGNLQERKQHRIKRTQLENKRKAEQKEYEKNYDKKWKKTKPPQVQKQFYSKCSSRKSSMRQRSQQMNKSNKLQVNEILRQMNYSHRQKQIVNNQDQQIETLFDSTQFDIAWKRKKMQEIYKQMLDLDSGPDVQIQEVQNVRSLIKKQLRRQTRQPKTIQQFKKAFPIRKFIMPNDQEDLLKQWRNDLIGYMEDLENYQNVLKQVLQNLQSNRSNRENQQESLRDENQGNNKVDEQRQEQEEGQRQEQEEGQRQEQGDESEQQQVDEIQMTVEEKFQQLKKVQQQLIKKYQQLEERQVKVEEKQIQVQERSQEIQNYLTNQNQRFGKLYETFKQQTQQYQRLFNQKQKQMQKKQKQMQKKQKQMQKKQKQMQEKQKQMQEKQKQLQEKQKQLQEKQKQLQEKQKQLQEKMKYINLRQIKINNEQILVNSKLVLLQAKEQKLNFIQRQLQSRQSKKQTIISQKQLHKKNIKSQTQNENLSQISENENQSNSLNEQNSNQNNFNQENNINNNENQINSQRKTQKKYSQRQIRKQQQEKSTKRKNQRKGSQQNVEQETVRRNNNIQTKRRLNYQTQYNISNGQINDQKVNDQDQGNQQEKMQEKEENENSQNDSQNGSQNDPQNNPQNDPHRVEQNAMKQISQLLPQQSANRQVSSSNRITRKQLEQYVNKAIEITLQRTILNNKNKLKFKDVKFILRSLTEQQEQKQNRNPMNEIKRYLQCQQCQQCQQQENQLYQQIKRANNIIMEQRSLVKKLQQQNKELQQQIINLKQSYQQQRRRLAKPQPQQDYCEILLDNILGMDELQSILLQGSNNDVQSIAKVLEYRMILITSYMTLCFEYYNESRRQQKVKRLKEKDQEIKGRFQWLSGNSQRVFDKEIDRFFMTFEGRIIE